MTFGSQNLLKLFPKKASSIKLLSCSHALVLLMMPLHSDLKLIKLLQTGLLLECVTKIFCKRKTLFLIIKHSVMDVT